jgi:transposase
MTRFVGLDVSQKLTSICVVDEVGRRLWRGQCQSEPEPIERIVRRHAGDDANTGIETGPMTPWLVHELRGRGLNVVCLDARHASAALKMQMNKTDQNDAEGLAQIMRTGWYRSVHVKSLDAHRTRALLGARAQLVGMTTRLSNHIRGVLKTFGMLPGAMRGAPFDKRVEVLLADRDEVAVVVRPMLTAWRQLREQIAVFDKAVRAGKERPDVPTSDERTRYRGRHCAGLCEYCRRSSPLRPIEICRCTHRADTKAISVRGSRS